MRISCAKGDLFVPEGMTLVAMLVTSRSEYGNHVLKEVCLPRSSSR
jgi:hypothetical protein